MPELPPWLWVGIILGSLVVTGIDTVKEKWHYHHRPALGCHYLPGNTTILCYQDYYCRDSSTMSLQYTTPCK